MYILLYHLSLIVFWHCDSSIPNSDWQLVIPQHGFLTALTRNPPISLGIQTNNQLGRWHSPVQRITGRLWQKGLQSGPRLTEEFFRMELGKPMRYLYTCPRRWAASNSHPVFLLFSPCAVSHSFTPCLSKLVCWCTLHLGHFRKINILWWERRN